MKKISQDSTQDMVDLAMLKYGLYMKLPQFAAYAENLEKTPVHKLCPFIYLSEQLETDVQFITAFVESMSAFRGNSPQAAIQKQAILQLAKIFV